VGETLHMVSGWRVFSRFGTLYSLFLLKLSMARAAQAAVDLHPEFRYKVHSTVAGCNFPEVGKSTVILKLLDGARIEGAATKYPYYWYFNTIYEALSDMSGKELLELCWTREPTRVPSAYSEENANGFIETIQSLVADNIFHHACASQLLHAVNSGSVETVIDRISYLKLTREEVFDLNAGIVNRVQTTSDLYDAGKESFC
jgi:hypothetical protein